MLWAERDGRAVRLDPRRFDQQNPAFLTQLGSACPGQVCGVLAGQAVTPLLATQPECSQQDVADQIIDASKQFDSATQANMVALAKQYRQAEKNTPPDFSKNPPVKRNSVFCQTAPRNQELSCLVQAQDPTNDPDVFFDPATGKSVQKGSQANTVPFGKNNKSNNTNPSADSAPPPKNSTNPAGSAPPPKNSTNPSGPAPASPPGCASQPPTKDNSTTPNKLGSNSTTPNSTGGKNLQAFTGSLGASAPAVTALGNGQFQVQGNANFKTLQNALHRSWYVI
jgi:hypothetical protein